MICPLAMRSPVKVGSADALIDTKVRVSGANGRYFSARCLALRCIVRHFSFPTPPRCDWVRVCPQLYPGLACVLLQPFIPRCMLSITPALALHDKFLMEPIGL